MTPPIEKFFLLIAILAMPNLYYRSEYNVPLMLFCFGVWSSTVYRPTCMHFIVFSWFIDIYCTLREIGMIQSHPDRPRFVAILQTSVFVLKLVLTGLLVLYDKDARNALKPTNLCSHLNNLLHGQSADPDKQTQPL